MKKNYFFVIMFCVSVVFLITCDKTATASYQNIIIPAWNSVAVTNIGYNTLQISSETEIKISKKIVEEVVLLVKENSVYKEVQRTTPDYEKVGNDYYLQFQMTQEFDPSIVYNELRVDFITTEEEKPVISVEKTRSMLKYPYENAEKYLSDVYEFRYEIQDFAFLEDKLFFHPYGALGLYAYNINTYNTDELFVNSYSGGDHIAADENYVFIDIWHEFVYRYNIQTDSVDLIINYNAASTAGPDGMTCYDNHLYILSPESGDRQRIEKFTYDGEKVDSISVPNIGYYLTIHDDIAYANYYQNSTIRRLNLKNGEMLPELIMPAESISGITIYKDIFFYADYNKNLIGRIWLGDMIGE